MERIGRRGFLGSVAAVGSVSLLGGQRLWADESQEQYKDHIVKSIEILRLRGKNRRKSLYIKATSVDGVEGLYGPIDPEAAIFADKNLKRVVEGRSALAFKDNWKRMFLTSRHSRGSIYLMGISAIDNVLWDLKGKIFSQPVYKLLGGNRSKVPVYWSCYRYSLEPDTMQENVKQLKQEGYVHQKWFLTTKGPGFGPAGLQADVESVRLLREAMGDDGDIMIDASRRWDPAYTRAWCKQVEKYDLRWIEEPFQSVNLQALKELSDYTSVPVAMGEHFYGSWDVHNYLEAGAVCVLQNDPEWTGGVSEMTKICTVASIYGAQVIPHGHNLHAAMHMVASQPAEICPLVEYTHKKHDRYYYFDKQYPRAKEGYLEISDKPGFGIELDESKIEDMAAVTWREI